MRLLNHKKNILIFFNQISDVLAHAIKKSKMESGIMPLLCKQRALYVKGCVIPNGIMDSQGDTLYSEDIKKIFTSFNNQDNFEVYHDDIPIPEVSLLENYISTANESIGNVIIPAGSWNCVIRVDNPEIQEGLLTGELGGLSLKNRIANKCKANLHGVIRYQDVADAECVIPTFISFVEGGANGYPLLVMDYDAYILKSNSVVFNEEKGAKNMAFNLLDGLKSLIQQAEASQEEDEVVVEKEDKTTEEEEVVETATEVVDETAEEPVVEKEDASTEEEEPEEEDEPVIEKEDEVIESEGEVIEEEAETESDLEARVAKLEELVAKLTAEEDEEEDVETPDPTVEPEDEDTPKIVKSEKVIIEDSNMPQHTNYFEMTGRDPRTGKKIRK